MDDRLWHKRHLETGRFAPVKHILEVCESVNKEVFPECPAYRRADLSLYKVEGNELVPVGEGGESKIAPIYPVPAIIPESDVGSYAICFPMPVSRPARAEMGRRLGDKLGCKITADDIGIQRDKVFPAREPAGDVDARMGVLPLVTVMQRLEEARSRKGGELSRG